MSVVDFLDRIHRTLGDVGYAILASVFLLICRAFVIGFVLWGWVGPELWDLGSGGVGANAAACAELV